MGMRTGTRTGRKRKDIIWFVSLVYPSGPSSSSSGYFTKSEGGTDRGQTRRKRERYCAGCVVPFPFSRSPVIRKSPEHCGTETKRKKCPVIHSPSLPRPTILVSEPITTPQAQKGDVPLAWPTPPPAPRCAHKPPHKRKRCVGVSPQAIA
jgi:hypothetical protein